MPAALDAVLRNLVQSMFPPRCIGCGGTVGTDFGLCPSCWGETPFIAGLVCESCGAPLPGEDDRAVHCDDCRAYPPPWSRGRAAIRYGGVGRKLILGLKHGDQLDLARPLADWLGRAAVPLLEPGLLVAPVPLHRMRLIKRRFNQSALLGQMMARKAGLEFCADLFLRPRATPSQEGKTREERFDNMAGAIVVNPKRADLLRGRAVLLVDDVMTSGATFAATTQAALEGGATKVMVVALARVAKDT